MDWNNEYVKIILVMGQRFKGEVIDTTFPVAWKNSGLYGIQTLYLFC